MGVDGEQLQYLNAMGIDVWEPRTKPVTENWDAFKQQVLACQQCQLAKSRNNVVFGVGNPNADLVIVGEAPGATEDKMGLPFVGRAGKLLDAMLLSLGLQRDDVFICNILKCRPPNNRDPKPEEIAQCTPFLQRQLAMLQPKLILSVGRISAQYLLQSTQAIGKMRGQQYHYGDEQIPLLVTYHPAYLLRAPKEKRKALQDLALVKRVLEG